MRTEELNCRIAEGADAIDVRDAERLLRMTYWAEKRPAEQIEKSMRNSACFGLYLEDTGKLIGFMRIISDYATTFYIADVVIDPDYRGMGLGTALVSYAVSRPEYRGLRGLLLTRDAHSLYEKFGFKTINGRAMEKTPG